ncbi:MAG: I78 family peptidase inhibitor [Alphaproteobacteria bacterium]
MNRQDSEHKIGGRRAALYGIAAAGVSALGATLAAGRPARAVDPQTGALTEADMIGKVLRVYNTGDPVTLDYSEDRLNIELGPEQRIARITIG